MRVVEPRRPALKSQFLYLRTLKIWWSELTTQTLVSFSLKWDNNTYLWQMDVWLLIVVVQLLRRLIVVVQLLSRVWLFVTLWPAACQASLSITTSWSPPKAMSIKSVMPSNHLILCHSLLLPSIFPSNRGFSNESAVCIRWPKYWSFSFNISPSNKHTGLISFRIDWFDLLAVQGTLKSLLQHHNLKASILWHSVLFMVQLSHLYMTTGKTIVIWLLAYSQIMDPPRISIIIRFFWWRVGSL